MASGSEAEALLSSRQSRSWVRPVTKTKVWVLGEDLIIKARVLEPTKKNCKNYHPDVAFCGPGKICSLPHKIGSLDYRESI